MPRGRQRTNSLNNCIKIVIWGRAQREALNREGKAFCTRGSQLCRAGKTEVAFCTQPGGSLPGEVLLFACRHRLDLSKP